ncbi:hypothetical protein AB0K74_42100 [Streptomyces sp. NPDC056159]|uniref:hypothetical protein n=1 Tax=Streptomyces sp. NPDC056159 TaxID=3155537 RepID=UPI00341DF382
MDGAVRGLSTSRTGPRQGRRLGSLSTARRGDQIAACLEELEHEYVTAVDGEGKPRFPPVVFERARAKPNRIAAKMNRPPKQKARPLAQLRAWWKTGAILISGAAVDVVDSLLWRARAAAVATQPLIRLPISP